MATFWAIAKNEALQLWRSKSFWLIQVFLLLPAPLGTVVPPVPIALVLLYLVLPILVGPALLREAGEPGELVWSSPIDALTHYAGVLAGLWLGLLAGSLLQLAGWFVASQIFPSITSAVANPPGIYSLSIWPASLAFLLLANTVGLFLTAMLAMLVRRLAPLLLLWAAVWLWVFMLIIFRPMLAESSIPMQRMVYHNIFFLNLGFSPSLGLGLSRERVFGMAAWFLGLGLLAAGLGLGASLLADQRRSLRRPWMLPVLILIGALAAGSGYGLNARAAAATAIPISPYDPQIDAWQVNRQQTDVEVDATSGRLSGTSRLTLNPVQQLARPELVLRLNPGLELIFARDEAGTELPTQRLGDSLLVSLPAVPQDMIQVDLAWQGRLKISYLSFEQDWRFRDFPDEIPYYTMPVPIKALLVPQGGFLLRDGDWMPWPWTSGPHQAVQNSLTIHPVGGEAVAARPLQSGAVTFEGKIPKGLVAFLPEARILLDSATLAASPLAGSQHAARLRLYEAQARKLASELGEQPPHFIVVAPYLSEPVWSGDLLLIPDGSGAYQSTQISWVYGYDVDGPKRPLQERNALFQVARLWVQNHFDPSLSFRPVLSPPGGDTQVISITQATEESWVQDNGHWMQFAEALDVTNLWTPVTNYQLTPAGEQSVLAFWLALELTDEASRQADLDLLDYFVSVYQMLQGHSERYGMISDLLWPDILLARTGREQVYDLHAWAEAVGREKAVDIAIEELRQAQVWDWDQILAGLETRSGVPVGEGRP